MFGLPVGLLELTWENGERYTRVGVGQEDTTLEKSRRHAKRRVRGGSNRGRDMA